MKSITKIQQLKTKNRITALLLALLLTATVLIPQIPVKAEETTTDGADISENNGSGGTSAGAGDNLPIDTGGKPTIITNEDGSRTLSFHQRLYFITDDGSFSQSYDYSFVATGKGKFTIVSYHNGLGDDDPVKLGSYLLSSSPFSINVTYNMKNGSYSAPTETYTVSSEFYKGVYYRRLASLMSGTLNKNCIRTGIINFRQTSYTKFDDALKADIDSGDLDLSKDDYISDEDKTNMKPVRDDSIGYLPRARYFDDREKHTDFFGSMNRLEVTSTIQWASFEEPYASDLDNPYYVEIYAKLHYTTGHKKENSDSWKSDAPSMKMYHYKKVGEIKYISERVEFPLLEPLDNYLQTLDVRYDASGNTVNSKSDVNLFPLSCYVSDFYVRLVHYDYEKQQLLCGGFTKLTLNDKGGSTSSEGDFTDDDPDGDWKDDPDGDSDKDWDNEGDEKNPYNPDDPDFPDPDDPDFDEDVFKNYLKFSFFELISALRYIFTQVRQFPDLLAHVFSFLPDGIINLMFGGIGVVILLRVLGR